MTADAERRPEPARGAGTAARGVADAQDAGGMWWSEYGADALSVVAVRVVKPSFKSFGFQAQEIRRQGQYTYARLTVTWEMAELSWATLCIDRPEERAKLARAAWSAAPEPVRHAVPQSELSHFVDQFCAGLWAAWCDANPQPDPTPISAARGYQSRWASPEQRGVIVALRQRLGILDTSDIPEQLDFSAAVRMIEHLQAELAVG